MKLTPSGSSTHPTIGPTWASTPSTERAQWTTQAAPIQALWNYDPTATEDDGSCIFIPNLTVQEIQTQGFAGSVVTSGIVTAIYATTARWQASRRL